MFNVKIGKYISVGASQQKLNHKVITSCRSHADMKMYNEANLCVNSLAEKDDKGNSVNDQIRGSLFVHLNAK